MFGLQPNAAGLAKLGISKKLFRFQETQFAWSFE